MRIAIEHLDEGLYPVHVEAAPDELQLPVDEARFDRPVVVDGALSVTGGKLVLQARIATEAQYECSRCLTAYTQEVAGEIAVLYEKRSEMPSSEADEWGGSEGMEILALDAKSIDIAHHVEEAIFLAMPMKPLCREDCRGLCPKCGADLNQGQCACETHEVDTRWQALRKLIKEE